MPPARPLERPLSLKEVLRFWALVEKEGHAGCWVWTSQIDQHQNPQYRVMNRTVSARRVAWDLEHPGNEPLGPKLKLMANCKTRGCVNPAHMTVRIGGGRNPGETCGRGHEFTEENTYITTQGKRACRKCIRITGQARAARYKEQGLGWGRTYKAKKPRRQKSS